MSIGTGPAADLKIKPAQNPAAVVQKKKDMKNDFKV